MTQQLTTINNRIAPGEGGTGRRGEPVALPTRAVFKELHEYAWAKYPWRRRLLDAMSCSALAFFAKPLLMLVEHVLGWSLPAEAPQALAIYIGYVGTDNIRERIKAFTQRKNQAS